ncbi:hypothetical protein EXIGLDRAFT_729782 [Exidia glandulosa HHB12029]|uniref:Uncharacterized protein n=1 Tax=Exidia glandulosa HHB12029 TaxID=1314781 RepID=A0A165CG59_EXIGL|nr:hypothetical protein EXIGLDRAFT_729782 [Exidia glandulosa HHB12029]
MAARALHGHREHERRATVPPDFIETAPTPKLDATPKPSLSEFPLPPSDDSYLLSVDRRSSVSDPRSAPAWIRDFAHESESALDDDDDDASTGLLSPLPSSLPPGSRRASSVFPSSGGAYDHPGQFTHRHRPSGSGSFDYRASISTYSSGSASLRPSMEGSLRPSMEGSLRPSMESSLRPSMDGAPRVRKDSLPRKMAQRLRGLFNPETEPPVPVLVLERKERVSMQRTRVGRGYAPMRRSISGST